MLSVVLGGARSCRWGAVTFVVLAKPLGQGHVSRGKGSVVTAGDARVVLKVGLDRTVTRVPFIVDERGGAGALFREQIGCALYDVISLDDRLDMWVDDEALLGVDLDDREAVAEVLNVVATMIAIRYGRWQPVFGTAVITRLTGESAAALDEEQLARLEDLAELSSAVFAGTDASHVGEEPSVAVHLKIKVENTYSDGHESEQVEKVQVEPFEDLEALWEQLREYTGDGHGIGRDVDALYTVTVLEAPERPELVGLSNEWG